MRKKLIKWLLKLLGHNTDNTTEIKISVDAEEAIKAIKKIQYEIEQINKQISNLPNPAVSVKEITNVQRRQWFKEKITQS